MKRSRCNPAAAVGLLIGIGLAACGGSEAKELADQPVAAAGEATAAPGSGATSPGDAPTWEDEVARLLDGEAAAFMTAMVEKDLEPLDGLVEQTQFMCAREIDFRSGTTEALAELGEPPNQFAVAFAGYLDARAASDAALAAGCDAIDQNIEVLEQHARAGNTDFTDVAELDDAGRLADAVRIQVLACFELQEVIAQGSSAVLNCSGEAEPEEVLADPPPAQEVRDDRDPTLGPTGGEEAGDFVLPAGAADFGWFPVPFTIDVAAPLRIQSGTNFIWIGREPFEGHYLELYAPPSLADPANPGSYQIIDQTAVPGSLEPWLAAMPIDVIEHADFSTANRTGTRWLVTVDPDAAIELTSEAIVALWPATFGDLFMFGFPESEMVDEDILEDLQDEPCFSTSQPDFYFWEMRASDGSLLIATSLWQNQFGECEDVAWVESLLATLILP